MSCGSTVTLLSERGTLSLFALSIEDSNYMDFQIPETFYNSELKFHNLPFHFNRCLSMRFSYCKNKKKLHCLCKFYFIRELSYLTVL